MNRNLGLENLLKNWFCPWSALFSMALLAFCVCADAKENALNLPAKETLQNLVQDLELPAAFHHVIFRDDFKPVDDRLFFKNMVVMRNAQPDSYAEVFVSVKAICGHKPVMMNAGNLKYSGK